MRKKTLDKVGLLDEDYFMYGEDIDLSYRILKGGYKKKKYVCIIEKRKKREWVREREREKDRVKKLIAVERVKINKKDSDMLEIRWLKI